MKRLQSMLLVAGLFAAGCKPDARVAKAETPPPPPPVQTEAPTPAPQAAPAAPTQGVQLLTLTIKVAPEALSPQTAGGPGGHRNCPQSRLQQLFGVHFSRPHGCIVGAVDPGSLAEQVGLKAGDSITDCNGDKVTCPASLLQRLPLGREPGLVELTITRRTGDQAP